MCSTFFTKFPRSMIFGTQLQNRSHVQGVSKLSLRLKRFLRTSPWSNIRTFGDVDSRIFICWRSSWAHCKLEINCFPMRPRTPPTDKYSGIYVTKRLDIAPRQSTTMFSKIALKWRFTEVVELHSRITIYLYKKKYFFGFRRCGNS